MLGREIKRAREAAGLTQEDLAAAVDLHRNYISLLERDQRSPSLLVFVRICSALHVSAPRVLARIEQSLAASPRSRKGKQPLRRHKNV